MTMYYWYI